MRAFTLVPIALLASTRIALAQQSPPASTAPIEAVAPVAPVAPTPPTAAVEVDAPTAPAPFGFADFSWIPGNAGASDRPLTFKAFTGEVRIDAAYHYSFNRPKDDTISGSSEVFRHNELQVTQLGFGGDFNYQNVTARVMTQFGLYSTGTPRNDSSPARGQWDLGNAYRYISEAYAGYHLDVWSGVNIQAGLFTSYLGLWSYYNFDNWIYQPSAMSTNTPWYFNGVRVQMFPTAHLKIEPWLVNGWQSYGKFNQAPGFGLAVLWRPSGWLSLSGNQYVGSDTLGTPGRKRLHTDESVTVKLYDQPGDGLDKIAAVLSTDAGCETGGGVTCGSQYFLGFMAYARFWFAHDKVGLTVGGGAVTNPGRYLLLLPPVNGTTAASGTPYFTANPRDPYKAWDAQLAADYMPNGYITFRLEYGHRAASVPYFSGRGGVTPPGGNQGAPGSMVDGWAPDLVKSEDHVTAAMLVKL